MVVNSMCTEVLMLSHVASLPAEIEECLACRSMLMLFFRNQFNTEILAFLFLFFCLAENSLILGCLVCIVAPHNS